MNSQQVTMCELDHKEGWATKDWCFQAAVLEKTLESPLHCKEIKPVNPKGNQLWVFIGRTDVESEAPILWSPDAKSLLIRRDPDVGKDCRQEEKGPTEDQMVGWYHRLTRHEFSQMAMVKDREPWHAAVPGVAKSQIQLSDWPHNNNMWPVAVNHPWSLESSPGPFSSSLYVTNCTLSSSYIDTRN